MKENNKIFLRNAKLSDAEKLYHWRNSDSVRKNSFSPNPITYDEHLKWLKKALKMPSRYIFIATLSAEDIGVTRLDITNNSAEISIYLAPNKISQGLGKPLLSATIYWCENNLPNIKKLTAKILPENKRSQKLFEKSGFTLQTLEYTKTINGNNTYE
ncbi:MAG: GNAT family N-acetyltransferase [Gammaproteobacteria bacterium]|nr:GNAT family N-acetyltransferase [Gammaproteobacteria bacterium]